MLMSRSFGFSRALVGLLEVQVRTTTSSISKECKHKKFLNTMPPVQYDYDVLVIGGGSGGLAASKEASKHGLKTAVADFVTPTPHGTTWGLGGTCVNVGCVPKKLMHNAALLGEAVNHDASEFGWQAQPVTHDWTKLVESVTSHIRSLNWSYKVGLRTSKVTYLNALASFEDKHKLKLVDKKGEAKYVTADKIILAVGGRPKYPEDVPGVKELAITSDDLFSLNKNPGKTLLVGASYIALESAGFLRGMGVDVTVMVRSILLRGFDQEIAEKIGGYMANENKVKFVRPCVPIKMEKKDNGRINVVGRFQDGREFVDEFDTVIYAVGRQAETHKLNLQAIDLKLNPKNGKVVVDDEERSSVDNVYAVGDILDNRPELTPLAIQTGILLARRLAGISDEKMNYGNVPTTVFTPIEYGCVGLTEEDAESEHGADNLEVYHQEILPLEWTLAHRPNNYCFAKMICLKSDKERVIGLHYLGPNAGEVIQLGAGMLLMGAKKADFDRLVGIHPTNAEVFTSMSITKASGIEPAAGGCGGGVCG